jgi:hypothetical protein
MKRILLVSLIFLMLLHASGIAGAVEPADYSKIIIMNLNISQGKVTEKSVELAYGHAPNPGRQSGDFKGMVKSSEGAILNEFDIWDARYQMEDVIEYNNDSSGYLAGCLTYKDNADFTLILPYQEKLVNFELYDKKSGTLLKSINLSPAISQFQSSYPNEPKGISISLPSMDQTRTYLVIGIILSLLLAVMILSMMRKK